MAVKSVIGHGSGFKYRLRRTTDGFQVQPLRRLSIHGYNLIREYGLETIRPSGGTAEKDAGHAEIRLSADLVADRSISMERHEQ